MLPKQHIKPANNTIGVNSVLDGYLNSTGVLHILGSFKGNTLHGEQIYILDSAYVESTIYGDNIFISGKVTGSIIAKGRIFLFPGAHIIGDITTSELITQKGVILDGHCNIKNDTNNVNKEYLP